VFGPGGSVIAALEVSLRQPHEMLLTLPAVTLAGRMLSRELRTAWRGSLRIGAERQLDIMIAMTLLGGRDGMPFRPGPLASAIRTS
jgi:hypothetical protein